jgi:hypothetical protein
MGPDTILSFTHPDLGDAAAAMIRSNVALPTSSGNLAQGALETPDARNLILWVMGRPLLLQSDGPDSGVHFTIGIVLP